MAKAIGRGYKIIGLIDCPACTKELPAKETGGGKLSLCCAWCDLAIYINQGTKAHELMLAKVRLEAPAAPAPNDRSDAPPAEKQTPPADDKPAEKASPPRRSFASPLFSGS